MTKIYLIDPRTEILVHGIPVEHDSNPDKIKEFIRGKEQEYGDLERVIVSMGTIRIMERTDPIPIPIRLISGRSGA